jgi:uncharacterized protein (TIGR03435 family)
MTPNHFSAVWTALAPTLGNHLWQSTLFALAVGLLTLALRSNRASVRHLLWLAASIKFLVPFSLLVALGTRLSLHSASISPIYIVMREVTTPFAPPITQVTSSLILTSTSSIFGQLLSTLLVTTWLVGFVAILSVWFVRWQRISMSIRNAVPLRDGREWETLRRLERSTGIHKPIALFSSPHSLEPGIFGIVRPVLIWPERISSRLDATHLPSIMAHEICHIQRRDNLAASIHMLVEAIFWFHPLVWWMGTRLVDERERACDEAVLAAGSDPSTYAESILKICEFCVGSSLPWVSGVTSADLKNRIVRIMAGNVARKLSLGKKILLSTAATIAVFLPLAFGFLHISETQAKSPSQNVSLPPPAFTNVSFKANKSSDTMHWVIGGPDWMKLTNVTVQEAIRSAYGLEDDRLSGSPEWFNSDRFDIEAKIDKPTVDALQKLTSEQRNVVRQQMLQTLLVNRFELSVHRETRELPVYVLAIAAGGPKLQRPKPGDTYANGIQFNGAPLGPNRIAGGPYEAIGQSVPITTLVQRLSTQLGGRTVLDRTGLTGDYDFTLRWKSVANEAPGDHASPILAALQEQLGLKLETQSVPMEVLVVDHAQRPAEN